MPKILFRSTNNKAELVSFKEALLKGQAPDYGLYMPVKIPKLSKGIINSMKDMNYDEIAFTVMKEFLKGEIPDDEFKSIVKEAYNFNVPLEKVRDKVYIMRLDEGPTAAFKDFAARLMARLMHYFASKENKKLTVLVATSGDTGGAVAAAFYGLKNMEVVVLFPEKEVTGRQRKQMTTLGKNIKALAVKGKFDDCQALVKRAFNDKELSGLNLTSANSINFGRLLPQAVYYFYAYSKLAEANEKIIFSVPSGNFGNLMGVIAREMGLPVEKFIVAVNENSEFPDFLESGSYKPVAPSRKCSSNAMDVGHPSNLARLIDLYGGWLYDERDGSGEVIEQGVLKKKPDMKKLRQDFVSVSISNEEANETIKNTYEKYKLLLEPHGAVGFAALEKAKISKDELVVCLETADPAKFPDEIKKVLNIEPKVPKSLAGLDSKEEKFEVISNSYEEFKKKIKNKD
ncbi:threonine synthase [Candidatus Woesearchaeota archaeon]|nr:threonine synthase [Candidatus Woesearchaeota archaeon]